MSVIEHEFGKKKRETVRQFTSLLTLDALHEANVVSNPVPYLERASEQIYQLEKALCEALDAAAAPLEGAPSAEMVMVNADEYRRLLNCRAIVEKALVQRRSSGED
ncbi:hypothetical protein [Methylocapsa palsarum]|uniref:Uncharacterized protein n=1 Tax=Methylocapsa palsarum TaxID=1612308 RepID=A0A1I4A622_9HYPH|nr:hypothetical protein [Methylocapsa palsarum]SFK51381.1 hypothetical protein SAMN05444581_10989 [Methylocapsa palsarum]